MNKTYDGLYRNAEALCNGMTGTARSLGDCILKSLKRELYLADVYRRRNLNESCNAKMRSAKELYSEIQRLHKCKPANDCCNYENDGKKEYR